MRSIISIILIICAGFIVIEFILACVSYKNREKIIAFFKRKKTWRIAGILMALIALIPVGFIILYAVVTPVLMLIRGDCFTAQHVYIGDHHFISYNDEAYVEFTDNAEIRKMYDTVDGDWSGGEGYVLRGPMRFPYLEYWELDMFIEDFEVSADGEYMITHTLGGQRNYRRAEE